MIKRQITEIIEEYDEFGRIVRKTTTTTEEDDSNYYGQFYRPVEYWSQSPTSMCCSSCESNCDEQKQEKSYEYKN